MDNYRQGFADLAHGQQLEANNSEVLNALAWLKATCADAAYRDPKQAVRIATELCQRSSWKNGDFIDMLAAAYAEQTDFEQAVKQQERALQLTAGPSKKRERMQARLRLYQARQPYREAASRQ